MFDRKKIWFYERGAWLFKLAHHLQTLWADNLHRKTVVKKAEIKKKNKVLDLGTATALTAIEVSLFEPSCFVIGIDEADGVLGQAQKNIRQRGLARKIKLVKGNIENLPFQSNSFDRIISCYGLGGVKNIEKAFEEMIRICIPGAIICLAEMVEPPREYKIRRFIHKHFVELWIKFFWNFRDLDLTLLFRKNHIQITDIVYFTNRVIGSTMLVKGIVENL